jgi:hypothetical protein
VVRLNAGRRRASLLAAAKLKPQTQQSFDTPFGQRVEAGRERGEFMPDYGEILVFLAANPPQFAAERELHASLLELLAKCLRSEDEDGIEKAENSDQARPSNVN